MESTVLVVEDDPSIRHILALTVEDAGFVPITAKNGIAALQALDAEWPSAILLDLEMPVMDGREFYHACRARGCDAPVLILSAHGARAARRELGADWAMEKPFDWDRLVRWLQRAVNSNEV